MKKIIYILFFILFLTNYLLAQKLTTTVSSNKVAVGEAFQIQFARLKILYPSTPLQSF